VGKSKIIAVSFSTLRKRLYFEPDIFVSARGKTLSSIREEIISHVPTPSQSMFILLFHSRSKLMPIEYLIIIDTLNPLSSNYSAYLSTFLSSLLLGSNISLLALYHLDIPARAQNTYQTDPITTLTYLATAILTIQNLSHVVARKKAQDRSLQPPEFGLAEHREGVLVGLSTSSTKELKGVVVEMEIRRKSGRGVSESFVLFSFGANASNAELGTVILLDDHPVYSFTMGELVEGLEKDEGFETTFSLGLSEKQKRDREGVVLPYFDAQKEGGAAGPGEGGRILYEMGAEDREDFDDEEDEI
jgi:elongator complex protein 5